VNRTVKQHIQTCRWRILYDTLRFRVPHVIVSSWYFRFMKSQCDQFWYFFRNYLLHSAPQKSSDYVKQRKNAFTGKHTSSMTVGSRSRKTERGTCLPAPVSEKNVYTACSSTSTNITKCAATGLLFHAVATIWKQHKVGRHAIKKVKFTPQKTQKVCTVLTLHLPPGFFSVTSFDVLSFTFFRRTFDHRRGYHATFWPHTRSTIRWTHRLRHQ